MTIQDMRYIVAIYKYKSVTKAAEILYVSQPSLSQTLRKVENELGHQLFIRNSGKQLDVTPIGIDFLDTCNDIISRYDQFIDHIENIHETRLVVGVPPVQGTNIINAFLTIPEITSSGYTFDFQEEKSAELEDMLLDYKIDLAIIRLPLDHGKDLSYKVLMKEEMGVILRENSLNKKYGFIDPVSGKQLIDASVLANEPLALPDMNKRIRKTIDKILTCAEVPLTNIKNYQSLKSIMLLVNRGIASAITAPPEKNNPNNSNFYYFSPSQATYDLAIVYRKGNRNLEKFIDVTITSLRNYFSNQISR